MTWALNCLSINFTRCKFSSAFDFPLNNDSNVTWNRARTFTTFPNWHASIEYISIAVFSIIHYGQIFFFFTFCFPFTFCTDILTRRMKINLQCIKFYISPYLYTATDTSPNIMAVFLCDGFKKVKPLFIATILFVSHKLFLHEKCVWRRNKYSLYLTIWNSWEIC